MSRIGPPPLLTDATACLELFVTAGVLDAAGVRVADSVARSVPGTDHEVLLAVAVAVRALQLGHVCVELDRAEEIGSPEAVVDVDRSDQEDLSDQEDAAGGVPLEHRSPAELPWPSLPAWADALARSEAVSGPHAHPSGDDPLRPLVFDGHRFYLERYWRYEQAVGDALLTRAGSVFGPEGARTPDADLVSLLDRFFGPDEPAAPDLQRRAALIAMTSGLTVLAGGPGTGKTHTVAYFLAAAYHRAAEAGRPLEVALAAPTGKAAARMTEAVHAAVADADWPDDLAAPLLQTEAGTLHRLLGYDDGVRFRHDHTNPLPHDLVVVDETSMVALPLMARLLDAVRPDARVVLVGDPYQLSSVEAGAVLGDIVGPVAQHSSADHTIASAAPLTGSIVVLERVHRFSADSAIAALADAVRTGDSDGAIAVLRDADDAEVAWIHPDDSSGLRALQETTAANAAEVARAALDGDARTGLERAGELKVLCATRFGPQGSHAWRDQIERSIDRRIEGFSTGARWYVGRPIIVTRNDYITGVFNGDTGLVVNVDDRPVVALPSADGIRHLLPSQLDAIETWWAMTIHKSQGSEFAHAVVSLPAAGSPILTRELLYTGVTRGKQRVTLVASEEAVRSAIANPVVRASGLQNRLWPGA